MSIRSRSFTYWWVSHGDEQLLAHGTCNRSRWDTEREALRCALDAISRGSRVIGISCPSGDVWDEQTIKTKLRPGTRPQP
jgi:hypothetical protein